MGTDIHGVVQRRYGEDNDWRTIMEIEDRRNYLAFAVLGGVRNGSGFAGVYTHEPVEPIQKDRGLPEDFLVDDGDHIISPWEWEKPRRAICLPLGAEVTVVEHPGSRLSVEAVDGEGGSKCWATSDNEPCRTIWMGDHSYGWVTLNEWFGWLESHGDAGLERAGWLSREEVGSWDGEGNPGSWSGGVDGFGVVHWPRRRRRARGLDTQVVPVVLPVGAATRALRPVHGVPARRRVGQPGNPAGLRLR